MGGPEAQSRTQGSVVLLCVPGLRPKLWETCESQRPTQAAEPRVAQGGQLMGTPCCRQAEKHHWFELVGLTALQGRVAPSSGVQGAPH